MRLRQQYLTKNDCYREGRYIAVQGVMIHSTAANNTKASRYVPGNDEIGRNTGGNHWDINDADYKKKFGKDLEKCVHAIIGTFADGGIGTVQTLPWTMRGWHCGGLANDSHIGIEICEDNLTDTSYFEAVYREAVEVTAMLCKEFGLDPLKDGVVLCHAEGRAAGIASNHGDVLHWWPKHGKSMHDFRADVARMLKGESEEVVRYNTLAEIRTAVPWAVPTIRKMIDKGYLAGNGKKDANGDPADLDLSMDMIRILVMNNSAGVYGN